eukprot:1077742-Rhodomonas_salina.2
MTCSVRRRRPPTSAPTPSSRPHPASLRACWRACLVALRVVFDKQRKGSPVNVCTCSFLVFALRALLRNSPWVSRCSQRVSSPLQLWCTRLIRE